MSRSNALVAFVAFLILVIVNPDNRAAQSTPAIAIGTAGSDFDRTAQPFLNQHCVRCHNADQQKGEFRIDTLPRDFTGSAAQHWSEIMGRISSGEMPPKKEPQPTPNERAQLVEFLAARLKEGESVRLARRERVSFHKLTREEYANTIYDLLGVHFNPTDPSGLSEDQDWNGFERIGSVLSISPSHIEKYFAAGDAVLTEALPAKPPLPFLKKKDAIELRGGPDRADCEAKGIADKVRVDLWPGADLSGGRPGPGQALPSAGIYKCRIQLSGLKPANGSAPHLSVYAPDLDRMLFERDVIAPEDKPTILEFETHLPAGNINLRLTNDVPGPSNLPRSGRADPRIPFLSIKDGRRPWQIKLTDEQGAPLWPFLIIDWVEWQGPMNVDGPTYAQREYLPAAAFNQEPSIPAAGTKKGNKPPPVAPARKVKPEEPVEARKGLEKFASRAFRRPATQVEVDRLMTVLEGELKTGESFASAIKTAMLAVLCSKDFLYLVEGSSASNETKLTDYELASRLSYFLWSTMPDAALLDAAKAGSLHKPDVLKRQVERMLADAKAERFNQAFTRQWLQLRRIGMFPPDKKLYPQYDAYLEKSMIGECTAYFGQMLKQNLPLSQFLDSDWTMLNARLARHYEIPGVNDDVFHRVQLKPGDHRGGLLTQAAVLSLTSDGTRHRPVHRGKWVLESIIGRPPPPPPMNVKPIEPTPVTAPKATVRMKIAAHTTDASCAACHARIDPLGLAFDNYDAIGRWRTEEVVSDGAGANPKVNASGKLIDGRTFADSVEFKKLLANDVDTFNAAFTEKLATFALRRAMTIDDRQDLAAVAKQNKASDYRLKDAVVNLVLSELFQKR